MLTKDSFRQKGNPFCRNKKQNKLKKLPFKIIYTIILVKGGAGKIFNITTPKL